jgi:hypothetical protein
VTAGEVDEIEPLRDYTPVRLTRGVVDAERKRAGGFLTTPSDRFENDEQRNVLIGVCSNQVAAIEVDQLVSHQMLFAHCNPVRQEIAFTL